MSRKFRPPQFVGKLAGFVYLATNPAMPGIVRAGRTQNWADDRFTKLNSAGVPEPFSYKCSRFFVDCFIAEEKIFRDLSVAGTPCTNKSFFRIDEKTAVAILETHYSEQHAHRDIVEYQDEAQSAFERAIEEKRDDWWRLIVNTYRCLPARERQEELASLLGRALSLDCQECAKWIVSEHGVDPEIPLQSMSFEKTIPGYRLTAYETAIFLGFSEFEKYLEGIGCNLSNSRALCWVVDCLVNPRWFLQWESKVTRFGVDLLRRRADPDQILNVSLFADAPWDSKSKAKGYDAFPRNSGKTCREVIEMYAYLNPHFAQLHAAMYQSSISDREVRSPQGCVAGPGAV